jgi:lysophospholipase L1-like esterase
VALFINAGDSIAAGYDAAGNNGPGGKGYARLLLSNHPDYGAYGAAHLSAVASGVDFRDLSESGATSDEIRADLQARIDSFPAVVDGDVLLTISAGGNDFNDNVLVMVSPQLAAQVAANLRSNLATMIALVRDRYEDPALGKEVFVVLQTIHDPTGGTGSVPLVFDDGFCEVLRNPLLQPVAPLALDNLELVNEAIRAEAADQGAFLSDNHQLFLDHGMNAPGAQRWLSGDCAHPTSEGHHQIRREMWGVLTGQRL